MAARLRTTFKYTSDEDNEQDDNHDDLDEEEQESLINQFKAKNQSMNDIYIRAFTLFPIALMPVFIYYFFSPSSIATIRLLSLLSVTSLVGSAFRMWFVPYSNENAANAQVRKIVPLDIEIDHDGPLGRFLPYLNVGICAILAISSWGVRQRSDLSGPFWMYLLLPSLVLVTVSIAQQSMSDVDRGIGELSRLRYDYKGA